MKSSLHSTRCNPRSITIYFHPQSPEHHSSSYFCSKIQRSKYVIERFTTLNLLSSLSDIMHFRSSLLLLYCSILPVCFSAVDQLFDDSQMENYDIFAPDDFGDQSTQSLFPSTDLLSYSDPSVPLFSDTNLLADNGASDCSSFDSNLNQFIGKRLDVQEEGTSQICPSSIYGIKRTNPGKYQGFNPDADPLVRVDQTSPEDEEFCPHIYGLPSYLICDSGNILDRLIDIFSGKFDLNNCRQSTISQLPPPSHPCFSLC